MLTYSDDQQLKADFVAEVRRHADADQIIQGTYGEGLGADWRGCAVGCAIHSYNAIKGTAYPTSAHAAIEDAGLWPEWLARLEDTIFEYLPREVAVQWPLRLAQAVPVGVDLESVKWRFCAFLMQENLDRVAALSIPVDLKNQVMDAVRGVLHVHENAINTGVWDQSAARSAESAARSAARSAESAARSAARSAAESAARSAWGAAESAWSAAESAAESADSAAYERYADKLIELLEASGSSATVGVR